MIKIIRNADMFKGKGTRYVIPVNCVGTMGNGLAKYFSLMYPEVVSTYIRACRNGTLKHNGFIALPIKDKKLAILFATKVHWRDDSIPALIDDGLGKLAQWCHENSIDALEMPMIGCGKGNLSWSDTVYPLIKKHFEENKTIINCYT